MKLPFANFFKKVKAQDQKKAEDVIHKPVEEIKIEKILEHFIPKKEYHKPPKFENQALKRLRKKRKIHNRISARSRRINFKKQAA
jgi:hypothetical protein